MIIPLYWTERSTIPNLQELLDRVRQQGGSIVEYQRVFSIILFTRSYPVFDWVPPGTSRTTAGLKHAVFCGTLGWWSVADLFWTPSTIVNNLMGGVDLTRVFTEPSPLPGQPFDNHAIAELNRTRKRQQYVFVGYILLLLLLVIVFVFIPYLHE
ncbi:MAG: hypothetical protein JWL59_3410 [Chthoniobacteraceae bacterium]|nr:hypothetical protein [Chthoniobacteraceae bacterium]